MSTTADQLSKMLPLLFVPSDTILIRPIEIWTDKRKHSRVDYKGVRYDRTDTLTARFDEILERSERQKTNLCFGVCPRFGGNCNQKFDLAWQIRTVRVLWSDIDHCRPEEALSRCDAAKLPKPSIVVSSGNGVHLYWLLDEDYLIDDVSDPPAVLTEWIDSKPIQYIVDAEGERVYLRDPKTRKSIAANRPNLSEKAVHVQDIVSGIAAKIGGDATQDLSRLLRLPSTWNRKDQRNGRKPVPCELVSIRADCRYSIAEFADIAAESHHKQQRALVRSVKLPSTKRLTPKRRDSLHDHVLNCNVAEDRSAADFALCCFAIKNGIEQETVWLEVEDVGKFSERGRQYYDATWKKAEQVVRVDIFERATSARKTSGITTDVDSNDDRLEVLVETDEYKTNDSALKALVNEPDTYQRGGLLVTILTDLGVDGFIHRSDIQPHIADLKEPSLRERLTRCAKFRKWKSSGETAELVSVSPPHWCVQAISNRGQWRGIRHLTGVVSMPVLRPDGSILTSPGYDQQTGLFLTSDAVTCDVPEKPSRDDARIAANRLLDVVCDFPFEKAEHKSTWLAFVLTLMSRYAFDGPSPLFLADANVPGSGKGLLLELVSLIVFGCELSRMTKPRDDDEFRKRITALALSGDPLVLIDNIAGRLGCPSLDAALTSTRWKDRILGETKIVDATLNTTWCASGNNVMLQGDIVRRVAHIRLDSPEEKPEERTGSSIQIFDRMSEHIVASFSAMR